MQKLEKMHLAIQKMLVSPSFCLQHVCKAKLVYSSLFVTNLLKIGNKPILLHYNVQNYNVGLIIFYNILFSVR